MTKPGQKRPKNTTTNKLKAVRKPMKVTRAAPRSNDPGALAYARLLADPCAATLAYPVYGTTNNGYLIRTRQTYTIPSTWQDWVFEYSPGRVDYTGTVSASPGIITGTATVGGTLPTWVGAVNTPAFLKSTVVNTFRPVAGCLKCTYIGAELGRAGTWTGLFADGTQGIIGGTPNPTTAAGWNNNGLRTVRAGEPFEIKWIPSTSDQATWLQCGGNDDAVLGNQTSNTLTVVGNGTPGGCTNIELTYVWEWQPDTTTAIANNIGGPVSGQTLSSVLRTFGDLGSFVMSSGPQVIAAARMAHAILAPPGPRTLRIANRPFY